MPKHYSDLVLPHGISTAFEMGLVFALLAAVISVFVIKKPPVPSPPGGPGLHDAAPVVALAKEADEEAA